MLLELLRGNGTEEDDDVMPDVALGVEAPDPLRVDTVPGAVVTVNVVGEPETVVDTIPMLVEALVLVLFTSCLERKSRPATANVQRPTIVSRLSSWCFSSLFLGAFFSFSLAVFLKPLTVF